MERIVIIGASGRLGKALLRSLAGRFEVFPVDREAMDLGDKRSIADWRGKTVLFNLWATWCAPCRAEMPALDALQRDLGGDKFEVVPVSVDLGTPEKPRRFYSEIGMKNAGFFHDGDLETLNVLKKAGLAFGLPATLLINQNGCVLGTLNGPAEWHSDEAKELMKVAF